MLIEIKPMIFAYNDLFVVGGSEEIVKKLVVKADKRFAKTEIFANMVFSLCLVVRRTK